jgi:hypothetical protein
MKQALAIVMMAALGSSVMAAEDESVQLKVFVDGMSCPTGCAPKVAKGLSALQGAKDVKLADFEAGLFTMSFDAKAELKPATFQKSLGEYKVKKIEVTLSGTIARVKDEIVLTTAAGAKYPLVCKEGCTEEKADAKKDAPKAPAVVDPIMARIESLLKENKTSVKVTGALSECCEVTIAVSAIDALEAKKPAN